MSSMASPIVAVTAARVEETLRTKGNIQDVDAFYTQQILNVVKHEQGVYLVIPDVDKRILFFGLLAILQAQSRSGMAMMVVQSRVIARKLVRKFPSETGLRIILVFCSAIKHWRQQNGAYMPPLY